MLRDGNNRTRGGGRQNEKKGEIMRWIKIKK